MGNRFVTMDYILHDALSGSDLTHVCITYDIWCKYSINLVKRAVENYPQQFTEALRGMHIRGYVPKFHLPAHGPKCQSIQSLNFAKGVGRLDGEAPERDWAENNELATQTYEMGPGARHSVLDDHFSHLNFRRLNGLRKGSSDENVNLGSPPLGSLLAKRLEDALMWEPIHRQAAENIATTHPELVDEWNKVIEDWQKNPLTAKKDPYREPDNGR
jgi:hypothetical protein